MKKEITHLPTQLVRYIVTSQLFPSSKIHMRTSLSTECHFADIKDLLQMGSSNQIKLLVVRHKERSEVQLKETHC